MVGEELGFVLRLLIDKRYRIYRNLVLQLVILAISVEVFFEKNSIDEVNLSTDRIYSCFGYFLVLNLMLYINIYVLAPQLLMKNKPFIYLIALLFTIIVSMAIVMVLQSFFYDIAVIHQQPSNMELFLSMTSSIISIGLMIISTSTLLLIKNWIICNQRIGKLQSATLEIELKFLKNQINPHFLFNMLNNANIMIYDDPNVASNILIRLDDLLRYQINDSTKEKVYLNADILFLTDFLDLEKTRRDDFDYTISKEGDINNVEVSPLLFIPFVENAVKHNLDSSNLSYVTISFKVQSGRLIFICENSKPKKILKKEGGGLGLMNIRRRLDLLYGDNYSLTLSETETNYKVHLILGLGKSIYA